MGADRTVHARRPATGRTAARLGLDVAAVAPDAVSGPTVERVPTGSSALTVGGVAAATGTRAFVERMWFDVALAGRSRAEVGLPDVVDESSEPAVDDTVDSVTRLSREAWADAVAAHHAGHGDTCREQVLSADSGWCS